MSLTERRRHLYAHAHLLALGLGAGTLAHDARADEPMTKEQCVAASENAITLRTQGKLRAARAALVRCGGEECPGILREDCASGLRALDDRIPTVVFGVRDDKGHEVTDGRIVLDQGDPEGIPLDGRARAFDPGPYVVRVMRGDQALASESVVLHEGEKNRLVSITVALPHADEPRREEPPPRPSRPERSVAYPLVPIALAGLGVAALAVAGGLSLRLDHRVSQLRDECAPGCSADDRANLSSSLTMVNTTLVTGIVLLAASGITWLTLRPHPTSGGPAGPATSANPSTIW
jgi:hypothetical protein